MTVYHHHHHWFSVLLQLFRWSQVRLRHASQTNTKYWDVDLDKVIKVTHCKQICVVFVWLDIGNINLIYGLCRHEYNMNKTRKVQDYFVLTDFNVSMMDFSHVFHKNMTYMNYLLFIHSLCPKSVTKKVTLWQKGLISIILFSPN